MSTSNSDDGNGLIGTPGIEAKTENSSEEQAVISCEIPNPEGEKPEPSGENTLIRLEGVDAKSLSDEQSELIQRKIAEFCIMELGIAINGTEILSEKETNYVVDVE